MDWNERRQKAVDLHLQGTPIKEAMVKAGYSESYAERNHHIFLERESSQGEMKALAVRAAGLTDDGYRAKLRWLVELTPGKDIPWPSYMEAMKLYAFCVGEYRKEGQRKPVPINVHIYQEQPTRIIEGEVTELPEGEENG